LIFSIKANAENRRVDVFGEFSTGFSTFQQAKQRDYPQKPGISTPISTECGKLVKFPTLCGGGISRKTLFVQDIQKTAFLMKFTAFLSARAEKENLLTGKK